MNNVDISFYGERGVINGIILDIKNDIDKTKEFFNSIQLLGTDNLPWRSGLENCAWLIEPSFAQFGNPDFIAVFESVGKKFGLFFRIGKPLLLSYFSINMTRSKHKIWRKSALQTMKGQF